MADAVFSPSSLTAIAEQMAQQEVRPPVEAPRPRIGPGPYAALLAGNGADAVTTWQALRRGATEANPVLPDNPLAIAALKGVLTLPQIWAMRTLTNAGHPNIAKAVGYGIGGFGALLAARNTGVNR